jgi:FkbM family methyltransferase
MLIPLSELVQRHHLSLKRILHVGAHVCEERGAYHEAGVSDDHIYWIEGNSQLVKCLQQSQPSLHIYEALAADQNDQAVEFIVTNNGQSSSILELDEHKKEHPSVVEIYREKRTTCRLDTLMKRHSIEPVDFINLDIQGAELLALRGLGSYLHHVQYIYTKVNTKALYKNCALLAEMDDFLAREGFVRKELSMTPHGWGDAFYVRERSPTFLVREFPSGLCGGLADRLVGLVSGILLARHSRRHLLIDWPAHPPVDHLWINRYSIEPHRDYLSLLPSLPVNAIDQRFLYQPQLSKLDMNKWWNVPVVRLSTNQEIASFVYQNPHYPHLQPQQFWPEVQAVYSQLFSEYWHLVLPLPPLPHGKFIGLQIRAGDTHMGCGHVEYITRTHLDQVVLPECHRQLATMYPASEYALFITSDIPCYKKVQEIFSEYRVFWTEGPIDHFERQGQTEGTRKTLSDLYMLSRADVVVLSWQSNFGRVAALMNPTFQIFAIDARGQWSGLLDQKQLLTTKHKTSRDVIDSWA